MSIWAQWLILFDLESPDQETALPICPVYVNTFVNLYTWMPRTIYPI